MLFTVILRIYTLIMKTLKRLGGVNNKCYNKNNITNVKEVIIMNKTRKILLLSIIILIIALGIITYLYFDMRKEAYKFRDAYCEVTDRLVKINSVPNQKNIIEEVKAVEDPEERAILIEIYLENGNLTQEIANQLY